MRNKPVAVTGATTGGFGAVWAQAELRKVLATTGGRVVEGEVAIGHATDRFDPLGRLDDPNLEEQGARWRTHCWWRLGARILSSSLFDPGHARW